MRFAMILMPLTMAGCAGLSDIPSLAPRPIEKIGLGTAAVPPPPTAVPADPALIARTTALMAEVRQGDTAFSREDAAGARVIAAGSRASEGSEAWIAGETARSALEAARQRSAEALGALDQLLVETTAAGGGGVAEIEAAKAQAEAIVQRQTDRLTGLSR